MLSDLQFVQPLWLLLFLPISFLLFLLWRSRVRKVALVGKGIVASHLARVFSLQGNKKASLKPILLALIGTSFVIIAIAGPQIQLAGDEKINAPLIIALDLSISMENEKQSGVSNLQRGKLIADQLLQQGFNRPVSLLAFAGSSHQVLPVSEQLKLLRLYLGYLAPSVMPEEGDDLNQLLLEVNRIKDGQQFGYDLLIISDGFSVNVADFNQAKKANNVLLVALTDTAMQQAKSLDIAVLTGKYLDSADSSLYLRLTDLAENHRAGEQVLTSIGYWLLYPVLLMALYFFRRGFNLHWAAVIVLVVNLSPNTAEAAFIDWWMTADQQGAYYFNQQDYKEAAIRFQDPSWQAAAYVYAKDYRKAAAIYEQQDDLTGLFNLAVTNSEGRNYHRSQKLYQLLLEIEPDNADALNNLRIITALIEEIKLTAENQQEEKPPSENADSEDMVDEQLAAEREQIGKVTLELETLSLDELLGSEQKKQQWLRDISRDPKLFLGAKFQAQYNNKHNKQYNKQNNKQLDTTGGVNE